MTTLKLNKKKNLTLFVALILVATVLIVGFLTFRYLVSPPSDSSAPVKFTVSKGETVSEVADGLQKDGIIRNSLLFKLFVRTAGFQTTVQAGNFILSRNLSYKELTYALARGTTDQTITIVDGWRIEQIADYLASKNIVSKQEFLDVASNYDISKFSFLPRYTVSLDQPYRKLEGYLFPDTYQITAQSSAQVIITKMLDNFGRRVTPQLIAQTSQNNLSLADTITLASIVEREANTSTDRAIVAGILLKRLQTPGWKLESDVTVQFAVGYNSQSQTWWKNNLTSADLSINSPYNTRLNSGLPPTPIDSPSLSAIKAVIYPQTSNYWYYLAGKDGKMHYATTLAQHNANIQQYLSQ